MSAWREALEAELFGGSDGDEPSAWDAVLAAELDLGGEPSAWDAVLAAELDPGEGFLDEAEGDLGDVPAEGDLDEAEGVLACLGDVLAEGDLDEAEGAGPAHAIVVAVHASRWSLMAIAGELRGPKDRLQVGRAVESLAKLVGLPLSLSPATSAASGPEAVGRAHLVVAVVHVAGVVERIPQARCQGHEEMLASVLLCLVPGRVEASCTDVAQLVRQGSCSRRVAGVLLGVRFL